MAGDSEISGFWSYLKDVVVKPWYFSWIAGSVTGAAYALTWVRDNLLREELQKKFATPHWNWYVWAIILLVLSMASVVQNSYILWREQYQRLSINELRDTAPEVEVYNDRTNDMGLPDALILRNASAHYNLHAICFQPPQLPLNDAERLAQDPIFRLMRSERIWERGAALIVPLAVVRDGAVDPRKASSLGWPRSTGR